VEAFARSLGRRAFGRPLADDEVRRLRDVYDVGVATEGHDAGLRLVAQAVLLSPHFLYRTELGPDGAPPDADVELTPYELASQLAFVFTGSRPDEDLLAAAERGELGDPVALRAQAERLLATPGARDQVKRFFDAWLDLARWPTVKKDPNLFPAFTPEVAAAMRDQAEQYVEDTVWNRSGAFEELLGADTAFVPPALAPIYGADLLQPPDANVRLKLDPAHRKGLLTLPAILAVHSPPGATSPVDRGMFVRVRLLCQDMGAPPLVANALPIDTLAPNATTREKFEKHGSDPACSPCHALIDPPGFALERFDTLGRRRDTENGRPVDASGDLVGTDVDGHFGDAPELVALLMKSQSVRACFVRQVFRFAEGRREQGSCETAALDEGARSNGHRVQDILLEYAARSAFRIRGGAK
jgi:hypothetical protein